MEFLRFLNFLLLCTDSLAWPVFALVYPLYASIRAIETGSKCHMRKLVIYWTLLSLIILFELAFVKILEWIPFWSCIKLIFICWLVVPRFNGACHVYESFVLPCLSLNLEAVKKRFDKPEEDKPVKTDLFLDVADKYIKENGSEALEKLIATKREYKKHGGPGGFSSGAPVQVPDKKNAAVKLDQVLKNSDAAQKDKEILDTTKRTTEAKLVQRAQPKSGSRVEEKTDSQSDVREITTPVTKGETKCPESPALEKIQREWTCALCLVKTSSESSLQYHLKGIKHKTKCEELRTSKKTGKGTGLLPSPQTKGTGLLPLPRIKVANSDELKKKPSNEGSQIKHSKEKLVNNQLGSDLPKGVALKQDGVSGEMSKLICYVCNVKVRGPIDFEAHLKGKKHLSNIEKMVEL